MPSQIYFELVLLHNTYVDVGKIELFAGARDVLYITKKMLFQTQTEAPFNCTIQLHHSTESSGHIALGFISHAFFTYIGLSCCFKLQRDPAYI